MSKSRKKYRYFIFGDDKDTATTIWKTHEDLNSDCVYRDIKGVEDTCRLSIEYFEDEIRSGSVIEITQEEANEICRSWGYTFKKSECRVDDE